MIRVGVTNLHSQSEHRSLAEFEQANPTASAKLRTSTTSQMFISSLSPFSTHDALLPNRLFQLRTRHGAEMPSYRLFAPIIIVGVGQESHSALPCICSGFPSDLGGQRKLTIQTSERGVPFAP